MSSAPPKLYEIRATLEDGWRLPDGTPWQGARVEYRESGSRGRWRRFLLEYDAQPTIEQLQRACAAHAEGAGRG